MNVPARLFSLVICLLVASPSLLAQVEDITASDPAAAAKAQAELLTSVRQLTFEGKRSGEGISARTDAGWSFRASANPTIPSFKSI